MAYYLAIDLGTTGCRSIVFDGELNTVGSSYEEYGLILPKEGWVEQDAELWWEMTVRTSKKAIKTSGIDGKEIVGLSVSSQGITVVPVDESLQPLCNALSWLDVRAEAEAETLRRDHNEDDFFALTGKEIKSTYTLPKLLWLKQNKAEIFAKAYKFLMPMDFLIARLTGEIVTDHSMASGTLMYDVKNGCWQEDLLKRYGIAIEKLPRIVWSGRAVGKVRAEIARELGLSGECVVAVGAQDQKSAAFGAGLSENAMSISLGTAAAITKLWTKLSVEKKTDISYCGYVLPSLWVSEGVIGTAGTCLRYVRDIFYKGSSYDELDKEVSESMKKDERLLFYPYLNGEIRDGAERPQGCFYGITLATKRGDYAMAVMEGVAFQMRVLLEQMYAYENGNELILFGGGAKSEAWCQIISDVTGMQVTTLSSAEAASAGAARLAALARGQDLPPLKADKVYRPSEERQAYYVKKYKRYCDIAKKTWGKAEKDDLY